MSLEVVEFSFTVEPATEFDQRIVPGAEMTIVPRGTTWPGASPSGSNGLNAVKEVLITSPSDLYTPIAATNFRTGSLGIRPAQFYIQHAQVQDERIDNALATFTHPDVVPLVRSGESGTVTVEMPATQFDRWNMVYYNWSRYNRTFANLVTKAELPEF